MNNFIEFSNEPILIKEENKQIVYRFNVGEYSPYRGFIEEGNKVKWDYTKVSAKTSNPMGIFGILPEDSMSQINNFLTGLNNEIFGQTKSDEIVILKLEVDKLKMKIDYEQVSFVECNIIEKISFEDIIIRLYPQYYDLVESYKIAKTDPTEDNKEMFRQMCHRYAMQHLKTKYNEHLKNGRITQTFYDKLYPARTYPESTPNPEPTEQIHGRKHSMRVMQNGMILSRLNGANAKVVQLFAMYHDCRRHNDGHDPEHGKRAVELLREIRKNVPTELNNTEFEELCFACENHTTMHKSGNITIDTCFDADRLDLTRIGIAPKHELMATETGAFFAQNMALFETVKQQVIQPV